MRSICMGNGKETERQKTNTKEDKMLWTMRKTWNLKDNFGFFQDLVR